METDGSVSVWIEPLKRGDERAAQEIFDRYFRRLVAFARSRLDDVPRRTEDEEDVALSALDSLFRSVRDGRYPQLRDRYDLWPLLLTITENKAFNQRKRQLAKKRGSGKTRGESAFLGAADADDPPGIDVAASEPTPELLAELSERCRQLLDRLQDESLRSIARLRLEGYTNEEIAAKLKVVQRTVERKLSLIREIWSEDQGA